MDVCYGSGSGPGRRQWAIMHMTPERSFIGGLTSKVTCLLLSLFAGACFGRHRSIRSNAIGDLLLNTLLFSFHWYGLHVITRIVGVVHAVLTFKGLAFGVRLRDYAYRVHGFRTVIIPT